MQNPMPLKFLLKPNVSDKEIHICYDYYCPQANQNNTLLEHILWVSEQHQISPNELATMLKKFRVYDTTIACQKCHILKLVTEPNLSNLSNLTASQTTSATLKIPSYICQNCYDFYNS